jgi:hypothetical protein
MGERVVAAAVTAGFIVSIMMTGTAFAAHPLLTDDTGTQGAGKFQLETTGTWSKDKSDLNSAGTKESTNLAAVVFTAGIADSLDLVVGVPYAWIKTTEAGETTRQDGVLDTAVEAKWRFWEKSNISLAIKPGILLPTGDETKGFGTGKIGYFASFISTAQVEPWAFDLNLAYFHLENKADERTGIWFGSLSSRLKIAKTWTLVGEVGATRNTDKADSCHPAFAQIGLIYSPLENVDLSAGLLMGLNDAEVDEAIRLGLTVRF